ncbi:MAG TPA: C45 family peptidase [Labilithrix sp.]|jgi:predicted choloylglycine hydrolase|nr:C45 family peptidase [Labilithrix sp.]
MQLRFQSVSEAQPGEKWKALFDATSVAYRGWFLREGDAKRPSYARSAKMLERHMPELVPMWHRLIELAGDSDEIARLLSLYQPTPYLTGCSQAVWTRGHPSLVRNYDYHPALCEGTLLHSSWHGTQVIAMNDCLWGVLDGLNEHGLAVSLSFGGRTVVGDGFGIPLVLRYILEFSRTTSEATAVLQRVPSHMAYNVTVLDARGDYATVQVAPDRPVEVSRARVATNHQGTTELTELATRTRSVEREEVLEKRLADPKQTREALVRSFLAEPVYSTNWAQAFGTLYTAAYDTKSLEVEILWPDSRWRRSFADFEEAEIVVDYGAVQSRST